MRGYKALDHLWHDVTAYSPATQSGISGNEAFATTCAARYLSRNNSKLDDKTTYDVSLFVIFAGLLPTDFYNPENDLSFTSSKTRSHVTAPSGATKFSVLEGFPHNKVHNYIGGVGPLDPGPYGNMTNFLSPVDPIFFLHHANMDRLWDVWTRKQKRLNLPYLPTGSDLVDLSEDPFLFYVDAKGTPVGPKTAGDYLSTERFDYDYEPGFGEAVVQPPAPPAAARAAPSLFAGTMGDRAAQVDLPLALVQGRLAGALARPLMAEITLPRPAGSSTAREFDVLVNPPEGVDHVSADSPHYAGTIAFFGALMPGMEMSMDATFAVPLPRAPQAFAAMAAGVSSAVSVRLAPSHGAGGPAPAIRSLTIRGG